MPFRDIRTVEMECCNCGKVVKATSYANDYHMYNIKIHPLISEGHICKPSVDRLKPIVDEYLCDDDFYRIRDIINNNYKLYILTVSLIETNMNNGRNVAKTYYLGDRIDKIKKDEVYDMISNFINSSKVVNYIDTKEVEHQIEVMVSNITDPEKYDDTVSYNDKWYTLSIHRFDPFQYYKELEVYQSEGV